MEMCCMSRPQNKSSKKNQVGAMNTYDSQGNILLEKESSILNNNFPYASPSPNINVMK